MAKQATRAGKAKKAEPAAEPFFRPFAKLGAKPKKPKADPASAAPSPAKAKPAPAPTPKSPPKPRPAEAEPAPVDSHTFAIYMAGVRALPDRVTRIPTTAHRSERVEKGIPPKDDPDAGARARLSSLVDEGIRFETTDDGERIEGRRLDVDPRDLRRLRRAEFAVDGKLDLHGLGLDEGRRAVEAFVKKRSADGDKVVLIVHGKGSHSPRQNGVLRGEIGAWLSQGRAARHVLAFATPPEDEGGAGAVLVLLAR